MPYYNAIVLFLFLRRKQMEKITFEPIVETLNLPVFFFDAHNLRYKLPQNFHEDVELMYCYRGTGEVFCENELIFLKEGDFCFINSMNVHAAKGTPESPFSFYNLTLNTDYCKYNGIDIKKYKFKNKFTDPVAADKITNICKCYHAEKTPLYNARFNLALLDFIIYLTEHHTIRDFDSSPKNNNILYAIGYIKSNFEQKLTIDEISQQAGLSRYHFSREFKKMTGYTVTDYLNLLRCERACQLFKTSSYSVRDVFNMSCFDNFSYFSKIFKKHIGISPSEYKRALNKI